MISVSGKVWGKTSLLFSQNNVSIHRIEGIKGRYCSKHTHAHKYNVFFVEKGKIEVSVWKNDYDLVDVTILNEKESTVIAPGEFHQFKVLEDCVVFEIYYTSLCEDDIMRDSVGGIENA